MGVRVVSCVETGYADLSKGSDAESYIGFSIKDGAAPTAPHCAWSCITSLLSNIAFRIGCVPCGIALSARRADEDSSGLTKRDTVHHLVSEGAKTSSGRERLATGKFSREFAL